MPKILAGLRELSYVVHRDVLKYETTMPDLWVVGTGNDWYDICTVCSVNNYAWHQFEEGSPWNGIFMFILFLRADGNWTIRWACLCLYEG